MRWRDQLTKCQHFPQVCQKNFAFSKKVFGCILSAMPFCKTRRKGRKKFFVDWSNNTLSNNLDIVGSTLTGLKLSLFNGSYFLNIGVMSAVFIQFGKSVFLMDSLIQFTKSLQSSLFTNSIIFVGITPLLFFVKSIEVIILEMSSLLTKLKSNSLIDANTDLILSIQGCMSRCLIAITSGSSQRRFEHLHLSMFNPLVMSLKYVPKRYSMPSFLETNFYKFLED